MAENEKLIEVRDLKVSFFTPAGEVKAVDGISYSLGYNEVMGIVGESGSGKSVEAYSIIGLLQNPGRVTGGSITFEGEDLLAYTPEQMRHHRQPADGSAALPRRLHSEGGRVEKSRGDAGEGRHQ